MSILGIDYGLTRIGVAVSEGDIATGIGSFTVPTNEQKLTLLKRLLDEYHPDTIVFGLSNGSIDSKVTAFIETLKPFFSGTIVRFDETMTTKLAQQQAISAHVQRKKRQANIDMYAAELILQSYLDAQPKTNG